MGRSQPLGAGTASKKFMDARRVKTLSETCKVGLLSDANELEVGRKHVFMQNDGSCVKNEGRGNNLSTRDCGGSALPPSHLHLNVDPSSSITTPTLSALSL